MHMNEGEFSDKVSRVRDAIGEACAAAGRSVDEVMLLPVTKNHPVEAAHLAWRSGLLSVGENRVQEALEKMEQGPEALRWELIGPLQSNKAKRVAERFHRVQTVDRAKIAKALDRYAFESGRRLAVLIQVNAGRDPAKSGVELEQAEALLESCLQCESLDVEGFMTIAPLSEDPDSARRCFAALRQCRDRLSERFDRPFAELSMGMSGDLRAAILEGSTMVRVGTALFGARVY